MEQANALKAALEVARSVLFTPAPLYGGPVEVDHSGFAPVLDALRIGGLSAARGQTEALREYLGGLVAVDPATLSRDEALAYWLNLYNAAAVELTLEVSEEGLSSVLRKPGAFSSKRITVDGVSLSLNDIEHGKVRRFGDPRIHAALVCGSFSCPTLRYEPFTGSALEEQLESQMRRFLAAGGAVDLGSGTVGLSKIFRWYGPDFVWPQRMPAFWPVSRRAVLASVRRWLPDELSEATDVEFMPYDWTLACVVS